MWMIILFFAVSFVYWAIKGIVVKKAIPTIILFIATGLLWYLLYLINTRIDGVFHWVFIAYLGISLLFYILFVLGVHPYEKKVFSGVYVKSKDVYVKYFWFKPITWLCANVYLCVKKYPLIGLCETVEVDVMSRDNVTVSVRL